MKINIMTNLIKEFKNGEEAKKFLKLHLMDDDLAVLFNKEKNNQVKKEYFSFIGCLILSNEIIAEYRNISEQVLLINSVLPKTQDLSDAILLHITQNVIASKIILENTTVEEQIMLILSYLKSGRDNRIFSIINNEDLLKNMGAKNMVVLINCYIGYNCEVPILDFINHVDGTNCYDLKQIINEMGNYYLQSEKVVEDFKGKFMSTNDIDDMINCLNSLYCKISSFSEITAQYFEVTLDMLGIKKEEKERPDFKL